jgi:hypothetical protein
VPEYTVIGFSMKSGLKNRLARLEHNLLGDRASVVEQINSAALGAVSDEDLDHLQDLRDSGAPLSKGSPEQRAALERYLAEWDAAAMSIYGRPLSRIAVSGR